MPSLSLSPSPFLTLFTFVHWPFLSFSLHFLLAERPSFHMHCWTDSDQSQMWQKLRPNPLTFPCSFALDQAIFQIFTDWVTDIVAPKKLATDKNVKLSLREEQQSTQRGIKGGNWSLYFCVLWPPDLECITSQLPMPGYTTTEEPMSTAVFR